MIKNNLLPLTIRSVDFNLIAKKPSWIDKLRKLTLHSYSGMNYELNHLLQDIPFKKVKARVILAHHHKELAGWGIISNEDSNFGFAGAKVPYSSSHGWLFEVYVDLNHRRKGIGSEIFRKAQKLIKNDNICVSAWSEESKRFYNKKSNIRYI